MIGCDLPAVQAVWEVEAAGKPYRKDGTLERRFEPHKLRRPQGNWKTSLKMSTSTREAAFAEAYAADPEDACRATSWGAPQIMGSNSKVCGYPKAIPMVEAFADSEAAQVEAFTAFILSMPALASAVRSHDWKAVARLYNGNANVPVYAARMETAYRRINGGKSSPVVLRSGDKGEAVRRLQEALGVPVDGSFGPETLAAVREFQQRNGLIVDGKVGAKTWALLEARRDARPLAQMSTFDRTVNRVSKSAAAAGAVAGVAGAVGVSLAKLPESTLNILIGGSVLMAMLAFGLYATQKLRRAA